MPRRIVIASGNAHKVSEIEAMLAGAGVALEVVGMKAAGDPPEIAETATTFGGNAALKAEGIASWLRSGGAPGDGLVLADDSGICIDAFEGAPGVYSARYAGSPCDDEANNAKMVRELQAAGRTSSPAHYSCVLAIARVDGEPMTIPMPESGEGDLFVESGSLCIAGHCFGEVRVERRGNGGFGYDPHFWLDDGARTMAELSQESKAGISHRGAAMRLLLEQFDKILAQG